MSVASSRPLSDLDQMELPPQISREYAKFLGGLIKHLLSENLGTYDGIYSSDAWDELQKLIIDTRSGAVGKDSSFIAPFLIHVVSRQPKAILSLLASLVIPACVHPDHLPLEDLYAMADGSREVERFRLYPHHYDWLPDWKEGRRLVATGTDDYRRLLSDPDAELRQLAADVLGPLQREKPEIRQWLLDRLDQETSEDVLAALKRELGHFFPLNSEGETS